MAEEPVSWQPRQPHILLGATGSVASIKIPEIAKELRDLGAEVRIVRTTAAGHFFTDESAAPSPVFSEKDEWDAWQKRGDPVLHVELRKWADIFVIAPLDANTLAKIAAGLCDNLLTCVLRAWDVSRPVLLSPAMNTFMWDHPLTAQHLQAAQALSHIRVIDPISKTLACGDTGTGAMATVSTIVAETVSSLAQHGLTRKRPIEQ